MALFSDDLVATVKRDSFLSTAQSNFTPADILSIADNCMVQHFIPMLMSLREGFYRVYEDIPFVDGQADYQIPTYAMYGKLESVQYLNINNQILPGQLVRIEVENLQDVLPTLGEGVPRFFSLNSAYITVYPTPQGVQGDAIRCYYDRRPGNLILTTDAAEVQGVDYVTGVVTYVDEPTNIYYGASSVQDFYRGASPYQLLNTATATAFSGVTQTFSPAAVADLVMGDWVTPLDQSVFIAMPEELMPFLSDVVIRSMARTQQDSALLNAQIKTITDDARALLTSTGNRLPGNPKRLRLTNPLVRNRSIPRYR
jgi:hypothetical protein